MEYVGADTQLHDSEFRNLVEALPGELVVLTPPGVGFQPPEGQHSLFFCNFEAFDQVLVEEERLAAGNVQLPSP